MGLGADMLREAADVVADRHKTYGPPTKNFRVIRDLWNAYHVGIGGAGDLHTITTPDVAIMMILVKVARLVETPDHEDSIRDIMGYAACLREVTANQDPQYLTGREEGSWTLTDILYGAPTPPFMPCVSEDVSEEDQDDLTMGR